MSTSYCNVSHQFRTVYSSQSNITSISKPIRSVVFGVLVIVRTCARYNNLYEIITSRYTYLLLILVFDFIITFFLIEATNVALVNSALEDLIDGCM